jgi:hypothetical protein
VSEEDRPSPGTAIARHRWGWPVPARKAVTVGLTVTAFALIVVAGTTWGFATTGDRPPPAAPRWHDETAAATRVVPPDKPAPPAKPPTRVRVPKLGVDSSLVGLRLGPDGALEAPKDYQQAGWYAQGTIPGEVGPAVIAGHVDSLHGPAVFYRLVDLRPGDRIEVQRDGVWLPFLVVATGRYPKNKFPTAEVYGPTPTAELRLITCGGTFDHTARSYRDNVVVYAVDARPPAALPSSKGNVVPDSRWLDR